jgi:selenocysteine lyase/cysteine desulfurase
MTGTPDYRKLFVGLDQPVPILNTTPQIYINFDNAASTPPFKAVQAAVERFMPFYSSVHRGAGFKSQLATHAYEQARLTVMNFTGADPKDHICIFGKNTTESINKLARRFPFSPGRDVVLVSMMEHHSNDLPWRGAAHVVHVGLQPDGSLDEADYAARLAEYRGRVALVSISGASNVTGMLNPLHRLAEQAHAAGALFAADCAQLAPHRQVQMLALDNPAHLDFVFISAHKMYAPYGTGALIGRRDLFEHGDPDLRGGGEVEIVTLKDVVWSEPPERDEAGSPNTVGAVALAAAIRQLEAVGMPQVAAHEAELTAYALRKLPQVPGLRLYGRADPECAADRLGVIPMTLDGIPHALVAAVLGYEFGIGVRNGCFCAHPYLLKLLQVPESEAEKVRDQIRTHDRRFIPGLVRASFGLYNTVTEVDALVEALDRIARREYKGVYKQDILTGEFKPEGWSVRFEDYFAVEDALMFV